MPTAPKRPCTYPGCPNLVERGRCDLHKTLQKPEWSALYDTARWKAESRQFLVEHPLCECRDCRGLLTLATVVDHVVPHRGNERLFWDRSNWQAMAKRCHDRKTGRETAERNREWRAHR